MRFAAIESDVSEPIHTSCPGLFWKHMVSPPTPPMMQQLGGWGGGQGRELIELITVIKLINQSSID